MNPHVEKRTRNGSAYFTVWWSPLVPMTKEHVHGAIPSLPGIFEVYCDDGGRSPQLVGRSKAYYGGLRNTFRGLIDTISPYPLNGELLELKRPHYVRYALIESTEDMDDVLFFYAARGGADPEIDDSGRYEFIYVKEGVLGRNGRPRER